MIHQFFLRIFDIIAKRLEFSTDFAMT